MQNLLFAVLKTLTGNGRLPRFEKGKDLKHWKTNRPDSDAGKLRIVGGVYGGRQINYSGDQVTRPMKDDIREAVFNLVGGWTPDKVVFDLFAGTGAMGFEAISRGASQGFLIERHFPTAKIIRENVRSLDPDMAVTVSSSDTFFWSRKFLKDPDSWPAEPWLVFCCPPYAMYLQSTAEIVELIKNFKDAAPEGSLLVVESDKRFDLSQLPDHEQWVTRNYSPAVVSIFKKFGSDD